jgi:MraZ protein
MVEIDSAGRIALGKVDEQARKNLRIDREVVVVGSGDRFEVWSSDAWKELNASVTDEDLAEVMSSLDF